MVSDLSKLLPELLGIAWICYDLRRSAYFAFIAHTCMQAVQFVLLLSRQGKVRLSKWYSTYTQKERAKVCLPLAGWHNLACHYTTVTNYRGAGNQRCDPHGLEQSPQVVQFLGLEGHQGKVYHIIHHYHSCLCFTCESVTYHRLKLPPINLLHYTTSFYELMPPTPTSVCITYTSLCLVL